MLFVDVRRSSWPIVSSLWVQRVDSHGTSLGGGQDSWQKGKELRWFPAGIPETKARTSLGHGASCSGERYELPHHRKLQFVEGTRADGGAELATPFLLGRGGSARSLWLHGGLRPGITVVLELRVGENRWETFQIWVDADPDQAQLRSASETAWKVLHPGSHWADRDTAVLGPSRQGVCGRYANWRISGKPTKVPWSRVSTRLDSTLSESCWQVRLLNEEQAADLDLNCGEESSMDSSKRLTVGSGDAELLGRPRVSAAHCLPRSLAEFRNAFPIKDVQNRCLR